MKMKHSEVAAKLAIEGAVAAIGGTVKGKLGISPRELEPRDLVGLGLPEDIGPTLYYQLDQGGVFLQTDGAYTIIWYLDADYDKGLNALDALMKKHYPDAKKSKDEPHATEPNVRLRTYDIKLPGNHLAIVDTIYASGRVPNPRFMVRISAMARQN